MTEPNRDSNQPANAPQDALTGPGGVILEQYAMLEQIGSSRMGPMYKARHRLMGRIVAVKFLSPEAAASATLTARFQRAIQVLAQLDHPNLVKALEAGEKNGACYLVMEYIDGRDLRIVLKEKGPLPWAKAVDYITQAAAALEYVHCHGVCHRNIKPGNLLLENSGTIRVTGLTLAHVESGGAAAEAGVADDLTLQGQVIGTYEYMSPEQAADSKNVDARSDVYSLGCTLHALVTGNQPYAGKGLQQVIAHRTAPIPSLCAARPEIPPGLDRVFQKMLAKRPADRYASMKEVIDALGSCQNNVPPAPPREAPSATASSDETPSQNLRNMIGIGSAARRMDFQSVRVSGGRTGSPSYARRSGPPLLAIAGGGALGVLAFIGLAMHFMGSSSGPTNQEVARSDANPDGAKDSGMKPSPKASSDAMPEEVSPSTEKPRDKPRPVNNPVDKPQQHAPPAKPPATHGDDSNNATGPKARPVAAVIDAEPPAMPLPRPKPPKPEAPAVAAVAPPPTSRDKRLPPPSDAARQKALRLLSDTYQDDIAKARSDEQKFSLAMTMSETADQMKDDPDGRYVLLEEVRTLAAAANHPEYAMKSIDRLARDYKIDAWAMKSDLLTALAGSAKTVAHHRAVAQQALAVCQDALRTHRFEIAVEAGDLAVSEANRAHEPKLASQGRAALKESKTGLDAYHAYEAALAALKTDPKSGDDNFKAGRYECLVEEDWTSGLPKLAAGSNAAFRDPAAKELAHAQQQVAVADGWWELSKIETGAARASILRHAAQYYQSALPQANGLLKGKIEKRLDEVSAAGGL